MNVLFLHQNFPGQFPHLVRLLQQIPGVGLTAITSSENRNPEIVRTLRFNAKRIEFGTPGKLSRHFASRVGVGEQVAKVMLGLRSEGYAPDIVIGHIGWGETLFVRDIWPAAKMILYAEFFYTETGADVGFDPEFDTRADPTGAFAIRTKNAAGLVSMTDADVAVAPTQWQASRFPHEFRRKLAVIHEGIDTDRTAPNPEAGFALDPDGPVLTRADEVITFVNRNLEPYRGYHVFMRALAPILAARPQARAVLVGGDSVSYGLPPPGKTNWKQVFLAEMNGKLPLDRVHFVGAIPYARLLSLLQISAAHVYLTYPFVLSWSMLDAMSAGALVIGSKTAPVEEVIRHGENGLLVDFFDHAGLAATVIDTLAHPDRYAPLRDAARETVRKGYDLKRVCLPKWISLLKVATGGAFPTPPGWSVVQPAAAPPAGPQNPG